jgi:hypothetical protein
VMDERINQKYNKDRLPEGLVTLVMMIPIILSMVVKSVKSEIVFLIWITNFSVLLVLVISYKFQYSLEVFIAITFISLLKLVEYQRQKISMFFLSQELLVSEVENVRLEIENRASELKHLIGNVAHDLKTVSFLTHYYRPKCS